MKEYRMSVVRATQQTADNIVQPPDSSWKLAKLSVLPPCEVVLLWERTAKKRDRQSRAESHADLIERLLEDKARAFSRRRLEGGGRIIELYIATTLEFDSSGALIAISQETEDGS